MKRPQASRRSGAVRREPFVFAAAYLDHEHLLGMSGALVDAGARLKWLFEPEPARARAFRRKFPSVRLARTFAEILADDEVRLVACAAVPCERSRIGCEVMRAGKDYFCDKPAFTTTGGLRAARRVVAQTGRKFAVYYNERLHVECAVRAGELIAAGAIGRVVQVVGLGPHRLRPATRPPWFFAREKFGGILCDIGCHQIEQFLHFTGSEDARILHAAVANHTQPAHPDFEDFGEVSLLGDRGASGYVRVDWLTPRGLRAWGDGRTFVLGTDGYLELRKFTDVTRRGPGEQLLLVDGRGERRFALRGRVGFPFFRELIDDCLARTERAMTQARVFKVAELALAAQAQARRIFPP